MAICLNFVKRYVGTMADVCVLKKGCRHFRPLIIAKPFLEKKRRAAALSKKKKKNENDGYLFPSSQIHSVVGNSS